MPRPGRLPNPGIKPRFPALQANSLPSEPYGKPTIVCDISFHFNIVHFYQKLASEFIDILQYLI